jgi:hypothetical protein
MKSKEEIEKMAEFQFPSAITKEGCRFGFVKGYEKCQENMAKNKYTEKDIKKAFKFYAYAHISQQPHSYEKLEQDYLQFINSLNKQDNEAEDDDLNFLSNNDLI